MINVKSHYLFVVIPLLVAAASYFADFNGLYGQDGFGYIQYAEMWVKSITQGLRPESGAISWPPIYAIVGAVIHLLTGIKIHFAYLIINYLLYGLSGYFLFQILRKQSLLTKDQALLYVVLAFMLSPYLLRQSTLVMSDMLSIYLVIMTYHFLLQWKKGELYYLILIFSMASMAIFTRYGAFFLVLIPCVYAMSKTMQQKKWMIVFLALIAGPLFAVPMVMMKMGAELDFLGHSFLTQWNLIHAFQSSFSMIKGSYHAFNAPNGIFILYLLVHPGFIVFSLALLPFVKYLIWKDWWHCILILSLVFYLLFLVGTPFQNPRYLLLGLPLVLMIYAPLYQALLAFLSSWTSSIKRILVLASISCSLVLSMYIFRIIYPLNQFEKSVANELNEIPSSRFYAVAFDVSLRYYCPKHQFISYFEVNIPLYRKGDFILFHEQYTQEIPSDHWERAQSSQKLKLVQVLERGWELYEVQ